MKVLLKDYFAASASRYTKEDAEIIGPVLEKLSNEGKSTAKDIVTEATEGQSPLHKYFEWDDTRAAFKYRLAQARHMSRSILVKVKTEDGEKEVRAFYAIKKDSEDKTKSYITIKTVQNDGDMSFQIIEEAEKQLMSWKSKFKTYLALFPEFKNRFGLVFEAIEKTEPKAKKAS